MSKAKEITGKEKPKVESLNLSLALAEVSLSLAEAGSIRVQNGDSHLPYRLRPSVNTTETFSHNPSCSLTTNSNDQKYYQLTTVTARFVRQRRGFAAECMCPNFDYRCSWVVCEVCSHWPNVGGLRRNLTKPGPSLKGPSRTSEMQLPCLGCGNASELFGFVKDGCVYIMR